MKTEKQLQQYVQKTCKSLNVLCYKFASPSKRGVPDLLLIGPRGHVVFIELKSPNGRGRLSKLQHAEIQKLRANKAEVYVIDEKNYAYNVIKSLTLEPEPVRRRH